MNQRQQYVAIYLTEPCFDITSALRLQQLLARTEFEHTSTLCRKVTN